LQRKKLNASETRDSLIRAFYDNEYNRIAWNLKILILITLTKWPKTAVE
jgi:hypothetical protein